MYVFCCCCCFCIPSGATESKMVLVQSDGKVLAWSEAGPTNQWVNFLFNFRSQTQ